MVFNAQVTRNRIINDSKLSLKEKLHFQRINKSFLLQVFLTKLIFLLGAPLSLKHFMYSFI